MGVYLDHAATTPMLPEAVAAYVQTAASTGNASSIHAAGQYSRRRLEESRETIAVTLNAHPLEVVFTSGGTEAVNLGLKGLFWARQLGVARPRIIVAQGEHHATIDSVEWLRHCENADVVWVPLDSAGCIRLDELEATITADPERVAMVSLVWANNEVGTIQPVVRVAALAEKYCLPLHIDAVAAYGHVPVDFAGVRRATGSEGAAGLVALSVSAHKIGGPAGIGALVVSRDATVVPLIHGGGQQRQLRSGTQDVAAAVAFAAAAVTAVSTREEREKRVRSLRDRLVHGVAAVVPDAILNGPVEGSERLPGNAHFSFPGCDGDSLLMLLDREGIAVSTGSACQAGVQEPSHVLRAMGRTADEARASLRVSLGHDSTESDVDAFVRAIPGAFAQAIRAGLTQAS